MLTAPARELRPQFRAFWSAVGTMRGFWRHSTSSTPASSYHLVAIDRQSGTLLQDHVRSDFYVHSSTAILSEKYRISSELRSQATAGPVSTTVGDHVGIRGAVGSLLLPAVLFSLLAASQPRAPAIVRLRS